MYAVKNLFQLAYLLTMKAVRVVLLVPRSHHVYISVKKWNS